VDKNPPKRKWPPGGNSSWEKVENGGKGKQQVFWGVTKKKSWTLKTTERLDVGLRGHQPAVRSLAKPGSPSKKKSHGEPGTKSSKGRLMAKRSAGVPPEGKKAPLCSNIITPKKRNLKQKGRRGDIDCEREGTPTQEALTTAGREKRSRGEDHQRPACCGESE